MNSYTSAKSNSSFVVFRFPKIISRPSKRNSKEKGVFSCDWSFLRLDPAGKPLFFLNFSVLERSFFFENRKTTNEELHLPQTCLSVKKGSCALRKCPVFTAFLLNSQEGQKTFLNHRHSSSWSHFFSFSRFGCFFPFRKKRQQLLVSRSRDVSARVHQCKSWSPLKRPQAHKVKCSEPKSADMKKWKCACISAATLFWKKSFWRVFVH